MADDKTSTRTPGAVEGLKAPKRWGTPGNYGQLGTFEQLTRVGVPANWLADLPRPGRVRGEKRLTDGTKRVFVSVGERGVFRVQVEDVSRSFGLAAIAGRRGEPFAAFMRRALLSA